MKPLYVQGVGAVSPLGFDWPSTRAALAEGRSAVGPIARFDASGFPSTVAAEVTDQALAGAIAAHGLEPCDDRRLPMATLAADEALASTSRRGRLGIFVGAESGRATFATILALARAAGGGRTFDHARFGAEARRIAPQIEASTVSPAAVASFLARRYGARGPVHTISTACSSGASAIVEAARALDAGACDAALCGGVGADVDPFMLAGFGLLGILSARGISRPFDARRDGFVVGEGAAFLVLSRDESGVVLAGAARSLDAHHLTAPEPSGRGAIAAMRAALAQAGVDRVDYIQAHGTSTPVNDGIEAQALAAVFGDTLERSAVGAVKGALGHWVAGAGAIAALTAVEAVASGMCLPTANLETPDASCRLPHVRGRAEERPVGAALVNAFAFGGANACLVFRRTGSPAPEAR